ncbi:MAG TPA: hypothetical protein VG318_16530 [Actinomycetota bacterium]|nr:hypothetical protein [Actinomycetota bacterium]
MTMRIAAALVVALLGLAGCEDDGASVRDLGGSASSGSGSGTGSGSASGSGTGPFAVAGGECTEPDGAPGVGVTLDEFFVTPEEDELETGPVRFLVRNMGEIAHELYVVQSASVEALPLDGERGVDEEALRPGQLVGEIEEVPPGESCALEVDLEPGAYVLLCNIVDEGENKTRSHFIRGMRARVKVS